MPAHSIDTLAVFAPFDAVIPKDRPNALTEILIMLSVSFALGYICHWLVCRSRHTTSDHTPKHQSSAWLDDAREHKDDLTLIEGIGPHIETLLRNAGLTSFADIAAAPPRKLRAILQDGGSRFHIHDPSSWPQQAALARDGNIKELNRLKDELTTGK